MNLVGNNPMKIKINTNDIKCRKVVETPKGGTHSDKKNEYKRQEKHVAKSFEETLKEFMND